MFTGIIENIGTIVAITKQESNLQFTIQSSLSASLKVDESIAHNGICLTITKIEDNTYTVTAIDETIQKTTIGNWQVGQQINLERALLVGARLDGHFVQGHVDATINCGNVDEQNGSWLYTFELSKEQAPLVVEKGSVCINGISLTCFNATANSFTVAIIPYTYEHTTIKDVVVGTAVNIEFDVIGKYILRSKNLN